MGSEMPHTKQQIFEKYMGWKKMPHKHENWDGNNAPYVQVLNYKMKMDNSADW